MNHDLVILGAGPGGYVAAIRAAQHGMSVALVERDAVGGTCLNRGCVPTKSLLHAAEIFREMKACDRFGLSAEGVGFDFAQMHTQKDATVMTLRGGIEQLMKANQIDLIRGTGRVEAAGVVSVHTDDGTMTLECERILIATGSRPTRPPIEGIELENVVTSDELLCGTPRFYQRLVIVGGGVIGVEFAELFSSLGCTVTLVEAMERILPTMDREISQSLAMIFKKRGISIYTAATVERFESAEHGVCCRFVQKGETHSIEADGILVAIGRRANVENVFAPDMLPQTEHGALTVNERYETTIPGIFAIGDVMAGGVALAHAASAEGENVIAAICGEPASVNLSAVPSCIYTDPEIASVGLSAQQAKDLGISVKTGKFLMSANAKSLLSQQERGFIKVVFDAETEKLRGAQLFCARATDLIGELSCALANELTVRELSSVLHPHPTFCEAVGEAVGDAEGKALHVLPKRRI